MSVAIHVFRDMQHPLEIDGIFLSVDKKRKSETRIFLQTTKKGQKVFAFIIKPKTFYQRKGRDDFLFQRFYAIFMKYNYRYILDSILYHTDV